MTGKKKNVLTLNQLVKMDEFKLYFEKVNNSKKVKKFFIDLVKYANELNEITGNDIPIFEKKVLEIEREIEKERAIINEPLLKIKDQNQAIFQPLINAAKEIKSKSKAKYLAWYRAEEERKAKVQAELDRKREEEQQRLEEERKKNEKNGMPSLPPIEIPRTKVASTEFSKSTINKRVKAIIKNKKDFVRHVAAGNNEALWSMINISGEKILEDMARANPGETEVPGYEFDYIPNLEAHLNPKK